MNDSELAGFLEFLRDAERLKTVTRSAFTSTGEVESVAEHSWRLALMATLLAPPQFPTIFPRVFNLMHYGQSSVLSFTVLVAIVTPVACAALTLLLLRRYVRHRAR